MDIKITKGHSYWSQNAGDYMYHRVSDSQAEFDYGNHKIRIVDHIDYEVITVVMDEHQVGQLETYFVDKAVKFDELLEFLKTDDNTRRFVDLCEKHLLKDDIFTESDVRELF